MALRSFNSRGTLRSGQGFRATYGDFSLNVTYSEQFAGRNKPVHVMLVIDSSYSMCGEPIKAVMDAVDDIKSWLSHPKDSMSMWTFNNKVLHKLSPTPARKVDMNRLRHSVIDYVQGQTRLHDALFTVCTSWNHSRNSRRGNGAATFMVFLTDGGENSSNFNISQVQHQLGILSGRMDKLIFLTAGSNAHQVAYLQALLSNVERNKYTIMSADSNSRERIRGLFGSAREIIEQIVVQYYHRGQEVARSTFAAKGGGNQRNLQQAALQDINRRMMLLGN